jgi:hypothetical protein
MASLYDAGWRQGSIVEFELPLDAVVLGGSGVPERSQGLHDLWVVATQECDLAHADVDDPTPAIELRPLYTSEVPPDWGSDPPSCASPRTSTPRPARPA